MSKGPFRPRLVEAGKAAARAVENRDGYARRELIAAIRDLEEECERRGQLLLAVVKKHGPIALARATDFPRAGDGYDVEATETHVTLRFVSRDARPPATAGETRDGSVE